MNTVMEMFLIQEAAKSDCPMKIAVNWKKWQGDESSI
jgi:hypothetical protein